ncbi:MAG: hypothetical protein E6R07_14005 [Nevskiaceae bacterium]|nr:MAG: hypothetical protein E6R07_14005 [Nevskiaceae bacterium]
MPDQDHPKRRGSIVHRFRLKALLLACGLLLAACGNDKASLENYKKLDWTMNRSQVYALLGKPEEVKQAGSNPQDGVTTVETWHGNDQDLITITFVNDIVAMKTMHSNGRDY